MSDLEHIRRTLTVLRQRWWVVLLPALVAAALAGGLAKLETPVYQSKATLLFETTSFDQLLFGQRAFEEPPSTPTAAMNTNVELVRQRRIAEGVRRDLRLRTSVEELQERVDVAQQSDTRLVAVKARDPDPREAARLANHWAQIFLAMEERSKRAPLDAAARSVREELAGLPAGDPQRAKLAARLDDLELLSQLQTAQARLTEPAEPPAAAISPRPLRSAVVGGAAGLLAGILLALLLGWLDRRLRTVEQVEALYGRPVLSVIPRRSDLHPHGGVPWVAFEEGFRTLRGTLKFYDTPDKPLDALVITSAQAGDGKTTLCAGLAMALASAGRHVVCIDADLRRPALASTLGVPDERPGVSDAIVAPRPLSDVLVELPLEARGDAMALLRGPDHGSLRVLGAGTPPPNPAELISSESFRRIVEELKADPSVDIVLIDTPPLLAVGDALATAPLSDAVLLAVRLGHSTTEGAGRALEMLDRSGVPVLGVTVLSGTQPRDTGYYYHRPLPQAANGTPTGPATRRVAR